MLGGLFHGGGYTLLALELLALGLAALAWRSWNFLQFLLVAEALTLALCLLLAAASATLDQKDGEVLVLFVVAIAAAESAVGIALYLRTLLLPPRRHG